MTDALKAGQAERLFAHASPQRLAALREVTRGSFTTALDHILLVAALIAFVCGVLAFVLIRQQDFVHHEVQSAPVE